ncbi:phage tail sheath C-terminal domain-containing protein [Streptomyces sp. NPDC002812]|uniref:phage tail sheath family protein n=1 Tax=Streptomyces sp. NPDC002812 TaxID=3154434 RepID=UPI0033307D11
MAVSVPGVYVEELLEAGVSVGSGPTAVPVFLADLGSGAASVVRLNNWLEFAERGEEALASVTGLVLRGYFANGGGYLYLVNTTGRTPAQALADLEAYPDITMLLAPGLWDRGAQTAGEWAGALVRYAAAHKAMAILHADRDQDAAGAAAAVAAWDLNEFAAVYHPWVQQPIAGGETVAVPPVGVVAGTWVRCDAVRGVWKAPANVALQGVSGPTLKVSDTDQSEHPSVNFIREFPRVGTVVWGARTAAAPATAGDWRYIPVRRLCSVIERDIQTALKTVVFEPNGPATWEAVRAAVDNYLYNLWKQGALMGHTPAEAYFVQVGKGVTMTDEDIKNGTLVMKIGVAALRPAEFISLEFTQAVAAA